MARGGYRERAGVKPTWKHGKTKTIRVPVDLADEVLRLARLLDEGKKLECTQEESKSSIIDYDTESKVVNLSGISLRQANGILSVYLEDLVKAGYQLKPEAIAKLAEARLQKLALDRSVSHGNNKERR